MPVSRRAFVTAGLVCAGLALSGRAEPMKTETLESALGDLVRIEIEEHAVAGATDVTLCLLNRTGIGAAGFDIRSASAPRFIASPSGSACTRVTPGQHKLFLWKTVEGHFSPVIQTRLDLSRAAGGRALITW